MILLKINLHKKKMKKIKLFLCVIITLFNFANFASAQDEGGQVILDLRNDYGKEQEYDRGEREIFW